MRQRGGPWEACAGVVLALLSVPSRAAVASLPGTAAVASDEDRLAARGDRWRPLIEASAGRHGIDPKLVEALVAVESGFDPEAVSAVGAVGLMQVMPETAAHLGLLDPFDPAGNLDAGTRHLAALLAAFAGDRRLAVAAYNAGVGAVRRAGGVPAIPETLRHVARVERYLARIHGLGLPAPPAEVAPIVVRAGGPPVRLAAPPPLSIRARRDAGGRIVFTNDPPAGSSR
jgi:soluble lytic murein transglycosylase-like protein